MKEEQVAKEDRENARLRSLMDDLKRKIEA
jgi:hypothetical protein